jgi:Skp family chaperone for outer membrane proteins
MKKLFLATIFGILFINLTFAQNMDKYVEFVKKADSLYRAKDYKSSAIEYQNAFDANDGKAYPNDRYNAACTFALAGDSEKAFYHLLYSAEHPRIKYSNFNHITTDSDLNSLHKSEKWDKLIAIVKANKDEAEKDLDKPLVAILDTIYQEDQTYRRQIGEIEEKFGRESDEMKKHWELINEKDSINLIKIQKILDEKGWLGSNVIGNQGNSTLFLVIQHSPLEVQEKYLPMMRDAVQKGNANSSSLALLEDRVALRKGGKQIYGSQIGRDQETGEYFVSPLIDPENVDKRRAEVGLGPIADYITNWNMTWDVKKHIERSEKQAKE